ncbi:dihydroneopterin aldolase [Dolosicoccus paucivorans]|uniref:dihydroneopterin aldolase n=1 Tax=Dolosicoccus paucivorans TaxID=84521 RepID=UPI00088F6D65|nr:dihydroneopterin aldolase [Dolosicoccus paucivorans]SDI74668.1 dihydroneopterin aldolase [Dolosicoccus paucivorans]
MDKIRIKNMKFYTYNGVLEEEKKLGQPIEVDVELRLPLSKAGQTDNVHHTINYAEVNEMFAEHIANHSYDLIEGLAYALLDIIEVHFRHITNEAIVRIRKYSVPMAGIYDCIEIEMGREFY